MMSRQKIPMWIHFPLNCFWKKIFLNKGNIACVYISSVCQVKK